jgi:hypothetical protein
MHRPDPVLDEIRRIRDERAARHHYDFRSMIREIRALPIDPDVSYVSLPPRKPRWVRVQKASAPYTPEPDSE